MLRSNLQRPAHMVFAEIPEETVVFISHKIVKSDAGTYEYFFYTGNSSDSAKQFTVFSMIYVHVLTWCRIQTVLVLAYPVFQLFFTCRHTEVGSRTTHIMNITFEVRLLCKRLCFAYQRIDAAAAQLPSLMESQCTETASAKAPTAADQTEFHFFYARNSAFCLINRMIVSFIRKFIDLIQFFSFKRRLRRVLYYTQISAIWFHHAAAADGIIISVL